LTLQEIELAKKWAKAVQQAAAKQGEYITEEQAIARIERQLLRWVDASVYAKDGGKVDEVVVSVLGMKGTDSSIGISWDYRNWGSLNPYEYNNSNINAGNTSLYSSLLSTTNYGLTPQQLEDRAKHGQQTVLEEALCLFGGPVGCTAVGVISMGRGGQKLANGDNSGWWDVGLGALGVGGGIYGIVKGGASAGEGADEITSFSNQAPNDPILTPNLFSATQIQSTQYTGTLNYVVTESGQLIIGRSGHISLSQGADVLAAGEVKFINGEVKYINNSSGHYQPSGASAQAQAEAAFNHAGFNGTGKYNERSF
jgi:hypothetical protein